MITICNWTIEQLLERHRLHCIDAQEKRRESLQRAQISPELAAQRGRQEAAITDALLILYRLEQQAPEAVAEARDHIARGHLARRAAGQPVGHTTKAAA